MCFRNEIKLKTSNSMEHRFIKWLNNNNGKKIHPNREVTSIYFDTDNLNSFNDSIEGTVPRKKIRLRTYNNFHFNKGQNVFHEEKFSSVEGRYKTVKKINSFKTNMNIGIFDNFYGIVRPKVRVSYERSYFVCNNLRFTIDKKLNYSLAQRSKNIIKDENIIIELKSTSDLDVETFLDENQFERTRFSKYCEAIEFLQININ